MVHRGLSPDSQRYYESAFPTIASRKAVLQFPREVPIDGKPADNAATIQAFGDWLTRTQLPKILFHGNPGTLIGEEKVAWCKENLSNLQIVDIGEGLHFVQEDNPDLIGDKLSKWYADLKTYR